MQVFGFSLGKLMCRLLNSFLLLRPFPRIKKIVSHQIVYDVDTLMGSFRITFLMPNIITGWTSTVKCLFVYKCNCDAPCASKGELT